MTDTPHLHALAMRTAAAKFCTDNEVGVSPNRGYVVGPREYYDGIGTHPGTAYTPAILALRDKPVPAVTVPTATMREAFTQGLEAGADIAKSMRASIGVIDKKTQDLIVMTIQSSVDKFRAIAGGGDE